MVESIQKAPPRPGTGKHLAGVAAIISTISFITVRGLRGTARAQKVLPHIVKVTAETG